MAILAGIDEAGLGPVLGPLVVSGVAFEIPDELVGQCLWKVLGASCTREVGKRKRRLVIADSKKLHKSSAGLAGLERSALVALAAMGYEAATGKEDADFAALLTAVAPAARESFGDYDWYHFEELKLPLCDEVGDVGTQRNAVRRDMSLNGVQPMAVISEPLPEGHYNRVVEKTRNKAVVLGGQVLKIVDRIVRSAGKHRHVIIHVDRLGGRRHYREPLSRALPDFSMHVLTETETYSAYRLMRGGLQVDIDFGTKGDDREFVVALASIVSKYIREVSMYAFNRYWCARLETLKPTAGYYQDAQRWLRDAGDTIAAMGVSRDRLIRRR